MKFEDLGSYFEHLADNLLADVPDIIAETATEYYKESFSRKGFDGEMWPAAKVPKTTGSLLVESGALVNSIRPAIIEPHRVVISAGDDKVAYARPHNEGMNENVTIPAHTRRTKKGPVNVKQHTRHVVLPKRQFMGDSNELATKLVTRIEEYIESIIE